MRTRMTDGIRVALMGAALSSAPAFAQCGGWICDHIVKPANEHFVQPIKQAGENAIDGAGKVLQGGGQILNGAGQVLTGHAGEGWKTIQNGGKTIINGVTQVAVTGVVTAVTMADPVVGTIFFGAPSPLQSISKFIYDTISHWKGHPTCNPSEQVGRLMIVPKNTLDDASRLIGAASTPFKYLSSIFDGYGAWEPTGCDAVGIGRPVREAQISTDGFWTVDLAISDLDVQGTKTPTGRYIRLEIIPGTDAHNSVSSRTPEPSDVLRFRGPMMWDKDIDSDHPHGHMEVHPLAALEFGAPTPPSPPSQQTRGQGQGQGGQGPGIQSRPGGQGQTGQSLPPEYEVVEGDCLAKIAEHFYGTQRWPLVFCTNRKMIKDPDLIFPGQRFRLPLSDEEIRHARCIVPIRRP